MSMVEKQEKRPAEAVAVLLEKIHRSFPTVSTRPIRPYEDEDFTLEIRIPADMDRDRVMDVCLQHAMDIEDAYGFTILTRVSKE
jgi:hypothetical protein